MSSIDSSYNNQIKKTYNRMGSSDSKPNKEEKQNQQVKIPPDPLIQTLRNAMKLNLNETTHATHSFLNRNFTRQISKNKDSRISQDYSPFCWIMLPYKKERQIGLVTCCLVSPIMLIAPMNRLCDPSGFLFSQNIHFYGSYGDKTIKKSIKKLIVVKESGIVLLILQTPVWELGWCGITYVETTDDIGNMPFSSVFNVFAENQKQVIGESELSPITSQKFQKIYCKRSEEFIGKSSKLGQNLLLKMIERKAYLVGVQRQDTCQFFTVETIKAFQNKVKQYVSTSMEKQYLKAIDIQQMEIQSNW